MARRALTPVTITERYPNTRTGRMETWGALSKDGLWRLARLEMTGTPWMAAYVPTEEVVWFSSLRKARIGIAEGSALACIEARRKEVA